MGDSLLTAPKSTWLLLQARITTAENMCCHIFAVDDLSEQIKTCCTADIKHSFMPRIWRAARSGLLLSSPSVLKHCEIFLYQVIKLQCQWPLESPICSLKQLSACQLIQEWKLGHRVVADRTSMSKAEESARNLSTFMIDIRT